MKQENMTNKPFCLKILGLLPMLILFAQPSSAQVETDTLEDGTIIKIPPPVPVYNAFFAELGGTGGLYSLNYDRILIKYEKIKITARAGYAFMPYTGDLTQNFIAENNYLFGKAKKFIEAGLGINYYRASFYKVGETPMFTFESDQFIYAFRLGYRFQNMDAEGFFFRAALTPFCARSYNYADPLHPILEEKRKLYFWAGIALGVGF